MSVTFSNIANILTTWES